MVTKNQGINPGQQDRRTKAQILEELADVQAISHKKEQEIIELKKSLKALEQNITKEKQQGLKAKKEDKDMEILTPISRFRLEVFELEKQLKGKITHLISGESIMFTGLENKALQEIKSIIAKHPPKPSPELQFDELFSNENKRVSGYKTISEDTHKESNCIRKLSNPVLELTFKSKKANKKSKSFFTSIYAKSLIGGNKLIIGSTTGFVNQDKINVKLDTTNLSEGQQYELEAVIEENDQKGTVLQRIGQEKCGLISVF